MMLLEQLHRLAGDVSAAAGAGRRTARFDTLHAVVPLEHEIFGAQLFGMEIDRFEHVDHRGHHLLGERERGIVFRVAADLQHALA